MYIVVYRTYLSVQYIGIGIYSPLNQPDLSVGESIPVPSGLMAHLRESIRVKSGKVHPSFSSTVRDRLLSDLLIVNRIESSEK